MELGHQHPIAGDRINIGYKCILNSSSKRLELPIEIMVHVEHDPVAVDVCEYNHWDDGIIHHYVDKFEAIYGVNDADNNLVEALVEKYGPIDLVLSCTPCQSYSGLRVRVRVRLFCGGP